MTSIVSYAQNFEDVMLWRALKHVENGFYIDLGAQDPVIDSVSLAFHEHGWRGVHVEPTPHYARMLLAQRPGDVVIEAAVADEAGLITFFEIPETGISTGDPQIAQQHREQGFEIREITVPCVRLSSIFKSCGARDIHWLKIDVEGFELSALASWGKSAARPWIVVVESTLPMSQIDSHQQWESLLLKRGYTHAYFDGLNRYYVSKEKLELKQAFCAPPNVFDGFWLSGTASAVFHLEINNRHNAEMAAVGVQMAHAATEIAELNHQIRTTEAAHIERARALQIQIDAVMAESRQHQQASNTEKMALQSEVVRASGLLVTAKDEFSGLLHNAHQDALRSAHYLAGREREFSAEIAAREQIQGAEISTLQAEIARASALLITARDDFAGQLQVAHQDALKTAHYLASREREFSALVATREQIHAGEISTLQAEIVRASALLITARDDFAGQLEVAHQDALKTAHHLAAREREFSAQVATLELTRNSENAAFQAEIARTNRLLVAAKDEIAAVIQVMQKEALKHAQALAAQESEADERLLAQEREFHVSLTAAQQESARQLQTLQFAADSERERLIHLHHAEASDLKQTLLDREREVGAQMIALQSQASETCNKLAAEHQHRLSLQSEAHADEIRLLQSETQMLQQGVRAQADVELESYRQQLVACDQNLSRLRVELNAMRSSLSWRITAPARNIASLLTSSKAEGGDALIEMFLAPPQSPPDTALIAESHVVPSRPISTENNMQPTPIVVHTGAWEGRSTGRGLQSLDDQEFVQSAYSLVLGRNADPGGKAHFLDQLRGGFSRLNVLSQLRLSPEGEVCVANLPEIDAELAMVTNAKAVVTTFAELLDMQGRAFVQAAYLSLLGREPDAGGLENCVAQLRRGVTKTEVLEQLWLSDEAQFLIAKIQRIRDAVGVHIAAQESASESVGGSSQSGEGQQASSGAALEDIFDCESQDFLCRTFSLLLGRMPDPKAFGTYMHHLDAGVSRIQLLAAIQASTEATIRASFLSRIELAIRHTKIARTPILGAVARIFFGDSEKHDATSRKFRALEFENALALESVSQRFIKTDLEIDSLRGQLRELKVQTSKMLDSIEFSTVETVRQDTSSKQTKLRDLLAQQTSAWKSGVKR